MFHTLLDAPHITVVDFLQELFCLLVLSMQLKRKHVDLPVLVMFFLYQMSYDVVCTITKHYNL